MNTDTTQKGMEGLAGAAAAMIAGSAKNLGQLLSVPVDFKLLTIGSGNSAAPEAVEDGVHLSVEFDGALTGDSWLVLDSEDAKSIVRIMTQGMGVSEEDLLGELGMSALSEAMNQLMAGAATALSDGLGDRIDISPPRISDTPETQELDSDVIVVTYEGEIAGQASSKVVWQIDRDLAHTLGTRWLAATAEPEPAAAPASPASPAQTAQSPAPSSAPAPAGVGEGVINSVELDVAVELGNVAMTIGDLLHMGEGSVVTLTQTVGDNVVLLANGTPVASGEVVVVDGVLGFRVAELITEAKGA
jgi:flagellar motor switch protein FliN/FliY